MATVYYIDGELVGAKKAKEFLKERTLAAGYSLDDAEAAWARRSRDEEAREMINNLTGSELEVFIEE